MRKLFTIIALLFIAAPARAQFLGPPQNVTVIDSGTACVTAPAACASFTVGTTTSVGFDVSGTWTGTLTFEQTSNGFTWRTLWVTNAATGVQVSTTTAGGSWTVANGGFIGVRLRATASITGLAVVTATRGYGVSAHLFDASIITGVVPAVNGGTGISSYAVGDLLYAATTTTLAKRAAVASGQVLASAGTSTAPVWTGNPVLTAGNGGNALRVSGMIGTPVSTQVPSTANTNFVCVSLGTILANTLNAAGDTIEVISDWERSAAAATITLTINIGGTCVADATGFTGGTNIVSTVALGTVSIGYDAHVWVQRGASSTTSRIRDWYVRTANTTAGTAASTLSGGITWSNNNTIGIAFSTSASGATDVKLNTARVMFYPAP